MQRLREQRFGGCHLNDKPAQALPKARPAGAARDHAQLPAPVWPGTLV